MIRQILELIQDIIVPENNEVQKLLAIPHSTLRELLPKSPVNIKDILSCLITKIKSKIHC